MSADDPSDADLVARSLAGDREAFGLLYLRHARLVRVVAGDAGPASVEDVVQEAFLRGYRNLHTLRDPARFASWVVGIARKVARETRRRPPGELLPLAVPEKRPGPAAHADDADEAAHLRLLVDRLPHSQRQAVQTFFLSGRNVAEVARLLGRSRSGTYALLAQAVATLGRWMGADVSPGEVKR